MNIIPWDGQPISAPGIYSGVHIDDYHHQLTVAPSISSGGLRAIETESCAHYFATSYLNPQRIEQPESEALIVGRAVHHLFGGEPQFWRHFAVEPETYPDTKTGEPKPWNNNATFCREWRGSVTDERRSILKRGNLDTIRAMADSVAKHPAVAEGILKGEIERSIVWQDQKTGVWLKSRPDVIPVDCDMIVDLKTCVAADHHSCCKALTERGYHMQLALAFEGIKATTGRTITDFVLVFVEKTPPYAVAVKMVDFTDIEYGRRQLRRALDKFAHCLETGVWPAYEDEDVPVQLQSFYRKRLAEDAERKLLPELDREPQMEAAE